MLEFMRLGLHSYLQFTQGIKVFEDSKQHDNKMLITVQTFHICFATLGSFADFNDFFFVK